MDSKHILLKRLADGEYHSGAALGDEIGISRAGVWKQLKSLGKIGLEVQSCKRRGYRIPGGISLLDASAIRAGLNATASAELASLEVHQQVDSTNDLAMERAQEGSASGLVLLAESQSAGKGRRGRNWVSPYGRNIYLSAVRGFHGGVAAVEGLSLAVGVAVAESLKVLGVGDIQLKWPNDILWSGRKLGGVLLEITGDPAGQCQVIVGIGINVQMTDSDARGVGQPWVNLADIAAAAFDRNQVAAGLLNELLPLIANYEIDGFDRYREAWQSLDAFHEQQVVLVAGENRISGIARGIDRTGSLCLETAAGIESFSGGEISLRMHQ